MKEFECDVCEELCQHPQAICLAKAELPAAEQVQQAAELFKVLGDATRIKLLQVLSKREMCVCDLAAVVDMGQSAISHQLRLLRSARMVKYRREGKNAWYSLYDEHIASLVQQGFAHVLHGQAATLREENT